MSAKAPLLSVVGAAPPPGGVARFLTTRDGVRLRTALWSGGSRGWAVLVQGRAEFIEKYYEAIARLRALDFSVAAFDVRGQGLSDRLLRDRKKGHIDGFGSYQRDLDAILTSIAPEVGDAPMVLFGHSMGGAVAARALMRSADDAQLAARPPLAAHAAVLTGPLFGLAGGPALRAAAPATVAAAATFGFARRFAPGGGAVHYARTVDFASNLLTSDAERFRRFVALMEAHPELELGGATWGWVRAALREAPSIRPTDVPTLIVLGTGETIVSTRAAKWYAEDAPNGRLLSLPGARHEPFIESSRVQDLLWAEIATFLDAALA